MIKKFFITGTSSGIGLALAQMLLDSGHVVVGIARRNAISHKNYHHNTLDLADIEEVEKFTFKVNHDFEELILVNNAGWIGEVKPVGKLKDQNIARLNNINITAPSILMNRFLDQTENSGIERTIVNVSSGAAKSTIRSWAGYCASKAAIDMFSRVIKEEHPDVNVYSIAPGVVDTEMQRDIREVDAKDFADVDRFRSMKAEGELKSSEDVARVFVDLLENKEKTLGTVFSLRDL